MKKTSINLCSRCTVNEIANWVLENQMSLEPEAIKQIREELKDIKLAEGECIVCKSKRIAEGCFDKVRGILEKEKVSSDVINKFKKFSGMLVPDMVI